MWVNSEKYIFTPSVVQNGRELFAQFNVVRNTIKKCMSMVDDQLLLNSVIAELVEDLTDLDFKWTLYERMYVNELQVIENDSRRFIFEAVDLDV
jgi:acyl transferase domain-containing protein